MSYRPWPFSAVAHWRATAVPRCMLRRTAQVMDMGEAHGVVLTQAPTVGRQGMWKAPVHNALLRTGNMPNASGAPRAGLPAAEGN